ncbi:SDR family oxidoreductase, partial [Rhodococcus hoagii]|nr:SDR family oxidoreductase [Prescottella equi]
IVDYRGRFDLSQRRFLVLGGGQGMGRQTSHALTQLGASVIVVDVDRNRAAQVCAEIGAAATALQVDATDDAGMAALAERTGVLDGVVDVIGMARYGPLLEITDDDWLWEEGIVLRHAVLALRHFGTPLRIRGDGSITFVSSVSGIGSAPVHAAYGAYKAALGSLVRSAASSWPFRYPCQCGGSRIRSNAADLDDPRRRCAREHPHSDTASTVTMPSDVASALSFLVSDHARTITGQVMVVDGGATNKYPYDMSGF